jgi:hypothetical protein
MNNAITILHCLLKISAMNIPEEEPLMAAEEISDNYNK